jgi:hypothetical protein
MADIHIRPRDSSVGWTLPTGQRHVLRVHRFKADLVELEGSHFHAGSAVMLPERDPEDASDARSGDGITGLGLIRAVFLHAASHPTKKLLCAGHTGRDESADHDRQLSIRRVTNVRALLAGDAGTWANSCLDQHLVRDYQAILKWIANVRYWPECDPGPLDGEAGEQTHRAVRAFKKRFNASYGGALAHTGTVDRSTWLAFFRLYSVGLAALLQIGEADLDERRAQLVWWSPSLVGCGDSHAIASRVEMLFFSPGEEPDLGACHPSAERCLRRECEIYGRKFFGGGFYDITPVAVPTNAKVSLRLTEVRGLYKPGFSDPADLAAGTAKLAGYLRGYKSEDDDGRIYVNQIPRLDPSLDWDAVKKKNQQYIELVATIDVADGVLPPDAEVLWEWSDPDDPSDAGMRDDAAEELDANHDQGDDNQGMCDFPTPKASRQPAFEQIGPYTLTSGAAGDQHCFTLISGGKSEVRFHCTDAGGDNFRLKATVRAAPALVVTGGDQTGIMSMWKRIDVEYRKMPDAADIPARDIVPFFEPQFIQMDVAEPQPTKSNKPFISAPGRKGADTNFVATEFQHDKKPGWFFICSARELSRPSGRPRANLYEGPATLVELPPEPARPPTGCKLFEAENLGRWEAIVIDALPAEDPFLLTFREGEKLAWFYAGHCDRNRPSRGKSTIRIIPVDFNSDFEPADGSLKQAYAKRTMYFPRFRFRWPEQVWEKKGYGFTDNVYVSIASRGRDVLAGLSPEVSGADGCRFFAGRTIIFSHHPSVTRHAFVQANVGGDWSAGDMVTVTFASHSVDYTVSAADTTVPSGVPDGDLYVRGQVARGIERAINRHSGWVRAIVAEARFGQISIRAVRRGASENDKPISISVAAPGGGTGTVMLYGPALAGAGFGAESRRHILQIITHEFGHAFGFPHKCGYFAAERSPLKSCTMNYTDTWPYKVGTQRDPAARDVERFWTEQDGHFCARHMRGMRQVRLEDNPVIWDW